MANTTATFSRRAHPETVREIVAVLSQGNLEKASSLACAALDRGELHALFLNLRASLLERKGLDSAALADLLQAHELDPGDAPVSNALGLGLMKAGRNAEAIRAYDAAIRIEPRFAAAHFNKGWACEAVGDIDGARRCYDTAIEIDPRFGEPFARLASLAARRGDFEEVSRNAGAALARQPNHPTALQALATAEIEQGRLADAEARLQTLLTFPAASEFDRYVTAGLLGSLRERQGRFTEAFAAFAGGNERYYQANRQSFAGKTTPRSQIAWLTDHYRARPMASRRSAPGAGGGAVSHVFLAGFPRSGTTLLEQTLASHPGVETMEEKEAFTESLRVFMGSPEDHAKLASLGENGLQPYRSDYWRRVAEYGFAVEGKVFVDKLPFHAVKLPLIAALFPGAKILFALRDPRDVVLGCLRARFRINPYMIELLRPGDAASLYAAFMTLAGLYRQKLPLTIYDVRHEELVADFDTACRGVCAFIGIDWNPSMRDFAARQQVRAVATPSARQLAGGLSRAGIGRWRHYAEQLAPLMPVLMPWVERFGYTA